MEELQKNKIDLKKVGIFVALAYALTWIPAFWYFYGGGSIDSGWFIVLATGCMFTPAISAIAVQRLVAHAPLSDLGLSFTFNKWFIAAAVIPVLIALASIVFSAALPDVEISNGLAFIQNQLDKSPEITASQKELALKTLEQLGGLLPVIIIGAGIVGALLLGPTLNAIPALGEELGWRGFLHKELQPLGFWSSSLITGVIWGFWHFPLIINGYNYPEDPEAGVFMMVLFTTLLSPVFTYVREKAETVLAAAVIHGTFNAIAGLPLLFFAGGSHFVVGVTGLAGAIVLIIANGFVFVVRKR